MIKYRNINNNTVSWTFSFLPNRERERERERESATPDNIKEQWIYS